jgi:hypothetical protein
MSTKYTKWPQNISNCFKIDQTVKNMPTFSIARPSKIYPNWDFWFESKPPGNPGSFESAKPFPACFYLIF